MSKPANVDIQNLFQKFGGDPNNYQEIKREDDEEQAQLNWPIIAAMRNELPQAPRLKNPAAAAVNQQPAPTLRGEIQRNIAAASNEQQEPPQTHQQAAPSSAPLRSLLGSLASAPAQPATKAAPADDSLDQVFSRLLNTPQSGADAAPQDNDLRSMLGRLKR